MLRKILSDLEAPIYIVGYVIFFYILAVAATISAFAMERYAAGAILCAVVLVPTIYAVVFYMRWRKKRGL
jgi:hypothetical protein